MGFWSERAEREEIVYLGDQGRCAKPKGAEPSRLQVKAAKQKDDSKEERKAKAEVWKLDGGCCRGCKRKVEKCLELLPQRAEFHHVSGRIVKALKWDIRNLLLLSASCHERLTGTVAEQFRIHSKHTYTVDGIAYINARKPVFYQRVA